MTIATSLSLRWQRAQQIDPASIEPLGLGWYVVQQPRQPRVDGEERLSGAPPGSASRSETRVGGQPEATLLIKTKLIFPYGIPTCARPRKP
jgi:hypothetical protein